MGGGGLFKSFSDLLYQIVVFRMLTELQQVLQMFIQFHHYVVSG